MARGVVVSFDLHKGFGFIRSPDYREDVFVHVTAVDGKEIKAESEVYRAFEAAAGKRVELRVSAKSDGSDARTFVVEPLADEAALRKLGARGVVKPTPETIQVIIGPTAEALAEDLKGLLPA